MMVEQPGELKKLISIATDSALPPKMRLKAIELLGRTGTREALLSLLELAANEGLLSEERYFALRQARVIMRSSR